MFSRYYCVCSRGYCNQRSLSFPRRKLFYGILSTDPILVYWCKHIRSLSNSYYSCDEPYREDLKWESEANRESNQGPWLCGNHHLAARPMNLPRIYDVHVIYILNVNRRKIETSTYLSHFFNIIYDVIVDYLSLFIVKLFTFYSTFDHEPTKQGLLSVCYTSSPTLVVVKCIYSCNMIWNIYNWGLLFFGIFNWL